jgi:hypothetical protein
MPALNAIIDPRQKGFVRGRRGEDNIMELTDMYLINSTNNNNTTFCSLIRPRPLTA